MTAVMVLNLLLIFFIISLLSDKTLTWSPMGKSIVFCAHEVTKKLFGDADPHFKYRSPLSARGNVIQFQRTETIFSTWRKLWTWLAKAEKVGYLAYSWRRPHSWHSVSLIRRGTGLCAKDTDTVTHIGTHTVSSQNKSVTESELGLNQSMTLSWGWNLELKMKTNWQWQEWQRHAHGHDCRWYCHADTMASL